MNTNLDQLLNQLKQTAEQRFSEQREFLAKQPQKKNCVKHPDCERLIDEKLTVRELGNFKAGYTACPKCVGDAQIGRLKGYGVPDNLTHATFENFIPHDESEAGQFENVKSFCTIGRGFLILLGGYGTGKSHLAAAALRAFGKGWFVKQSSLLVALRQTYRDKAAFDPIERAKSARLFVLDDIGLSSGGRDELPLLHEILDYRHGERVATIITSNLDWDGLVSVIGERMADRLNESAFRVLKFNGSSNRKVARDRYFDQ